MHTVTQKTVVYSFEELEDSAKETARTWYREGMFDYDWYEFVYEDAAEIASLFGLDIRTKRVKLMNGETRFDPCIYFSGFSSQGDGACYEGEYSYKPGALKAVKEYAPLDTDLHDIVKSLQDIQRPNFYRLSASTKHQGHYCHSGCMAVYVEDEYGTLETDQDMIDTLRLFADWIYSRLEAEHDYMNEDATVDENIRCNDYEFTEDGSIY